MGETDSGRNITFRWRIQEMIFFYERTAPKISRPVIPVFLKSGKNFVFYAGLIDSGADYCVFSLGVAKALNLKLSKQNVVIEGISQGRISGEVGVVMIKIGHLSYHTKAVFADIRDPGYGILGGRGFFDHFDVKLSYRKQTIEIQPILRSS